MPRLTILVVCRGGSGGGGGQGHAHIKQYYHRRPNVLKLVQLLSTTSIKELSNLGKYLERSNKLRNKLLEL